AHRGERLVQGRPLDVQADPSLDAGSTGRQNEVQGGQLVEHEENVAQPYAVQMESESVLGGRRPMSYDPAAGGLGRADLGGPEIEKAVEDYRLPGHLTRFQARGGRERLPPTGRRHLDVAHEEAGLGESWLEPVACRGAGDDSLEDDFAAGPERGERRGPLPVQVVEGGQGGDEPGLRSLRDLGEQAVGRFELAQLVPVSGDDVRRQRLDLLRRIQIAEEGEARGEADDVACLH